MRLPGLISDAFALGRFLLDGIPPGVLGSIDATDRCNLRCKHCYFFSPHYEQAGALDLEAWRARFEAMKAAGRRLYGVTWVGGEPLLRKDVIELGMRYFRFNKVVTNGTIPLPRWPRVSFVVSVDGTAAAHERQRGARTYGKIKANVRAAAPRLNVALHCCLTSVNVDCIEDFLDE